MASSRRTRSIKWNRVTDGHLIESNEELGDYSIVQEKIMHGPSGWRAGARGPMPFLSMMSSGPVKRTTLAGGGQDNGNSSISSYRFAE